MCAEWALLPIGSSEMLDWFLKPPQNHEVAKRNHEKRSHQKLGRKNAITPNKALQLFFIVAVILATLLLVTTLAVAAPKAKTPTVPVFPGTLVNARYVYVTSYDGDQFDPNLFPADRDAIGAVQDSIQKWGKFVVVYEPRQADVVLMVMSRPSEDVLAVYDAHGWPKNEYLWRMMSRSGLQTGETPLATDLENAFDQATAK